MAISTFRKLSLAAALFLSASVSVAGPLVIGEVAAFSDPETAGPHLRVGLQTYFEAVNRSGGVHGATIKFVSKERGPKPSEIVNKVRELIDESQPLALAGLMGTGSMEEIMKSGILENTGIPVVGIRSGSVSLHEPVNPYLFHTRANYLGEVEKITTQLTTIGLNRIAVFHEKSPFGQEVFSLIQRRLQKLPAMRLVGQGSYEVRDPNVKEAVASILNSKPDGVIVIANSTAAAEFYKAFRASGGKVQVVSLSVADGGEIVKRIGKDGARGLIVSQVVPDPNNSAMPLIRELQSNIKKYAPPGTPINQAVVEGYIAAKTVVEGLRRAGPNPTRQKLRSALESINKFDTGGVILGYSPTNHTGSQYVELGMLLSSGRVMK